MLPYIETENDIKEKFYPTNRIRIPVNKQKVLENGIVALKKMPTKLFLTLISTLTIGPYLKIEF